MKVIYWLFVLLLGAGPIFAQAIGSSVEIVTVYSQNKNFYLKSTPYDNEFPTLRGKTSVYAKGNPKPLYEFERGFDSVDKESNNLFLSNDGEIIMFVIPWEANEEKEGLKSVTFYKNGVIFKSYTEAEITGCDLQKERCSLLYDNDDNVIDEAKSNWGTPNYRKVFKAGVDEKEKFLSDFAIFGVDEAVYLTDSKKNVHVFSLKTGELVKSDAFEKIYEQIKGRGRANEISVREFDAPTFLDYPNLKTGKTAVQALAEYLGMKPFGIYDKKDEQFKRYSFQLDSFVLRDGSIEIEATDIGSDLPKEKIIEFFKTNKFDSRSVPPAFEKWYVGEKIFFLRKADDQLSRRERQEELVREREELNKRMTAEKIADVYIPKDLGECFAELDRLLSEVDRKEMRALAKRDDMLRYHMGLGMWMRNNWGLWGGSRLQKYFTEKGVAHPDNMSSVVLFFYHDWLNGRKETWKAWEKNPKL